MKKCFFAHKNAKAKCITSNFYLTASSIKLIWQNVYRWNVNLVAEKKSKNSLNISMLLIINAVKRLSIGRV